MSKNIIWRIFWKINYANHLNVFSTKIELIILIHCKSVNLLIMHSMRTEFFYKLNGANLAWYLFEQTNNLQNDPSGIDAISYIIVEMANG